MHGGGDWLVHSLEARNQLTAGRCRRRPVELSDVGAGDEGLAVTGNDHTFDCRIHVRRVKALVEGTAHRMTERVDRRTIDGEDDDLAATFGRA